MSQRRVYWLNLPSDFFKRPEIKCILEASHGGEVLLMYLYLLCESLDTDGLLRFKAQIPYTPEILAAAYGINPMVTAMGLRLLRVLGLVRIMEDETLFMTQQPLMVGSECMSAERVRNHRARKRTSLEMVGEYDDERTAEEAEATPQPLALPSADKDYGILPQKPRRYAFFDLMRKAAALFCNLLSFQKKPK